MWVLGTESGSFAISALHSCVITPAPLLELLNLLLQCTTMPGGSGILKTQLLYILQSHDIYQIEAGLWSPGRSSCLYKSRGIVLIQRQSFFKANSSLTFLVPFLRTSNRVIRLSWKIPSTRVWKAGLGRLDMNSYFLLHSSDVISPKRLHWLASSASVPKS